MNFENTKKFLGNAYNQETQKLDNNKAEQEAFSQKEKFNILLIGATGVGKSSLINAFFGSEIVKSGVGKPITQHLEKIDLPKKGLVLWDTKGIESKDYKDTVNKLELEIKNAFDHLQDVKEYPHLAWLCIDCSSGRIEERDLELIDILKNANILIIVVFTKYLGEDSDPFIEEVKKVINEKHSDYVEGNYVAVNSVVRTISGHTIPVTGLTDLLDVSSKRIPEGMAEAKRALEKAQKVRSDIRLGKMVEGSYKIVHLAAAAAGAVGASPIPGSDAPLIAAVQSTMIYKINAEFELDSNTSNTTSVIAGILGVTAVAQVGKAIVSNALKFIPFVGSVIGGVISATTAIALTEAVGHAYIQVLKSYYNHKSHMVELPDQVASIMSTFKEYFQFKK